MYIQTKDVSVFDNASLSLVIKEEKAVLPTHVILTLEKKAELTLFSPCCFVNKSEGMFFPDDIRKISNDKNMKGWLGTVEFDVCDKESWEHRYLPYMAMDYLDYLVNKGSLSLNVFDPKVIDYHSKHPDLSVNVIAQKMRLFDVMVYLAYEVFLIKHTYNRFSNDTLTAPFAMLQCLRDARGKIHEGFGRLRKLIENNETTSQDIENQVENTIFVAKELADKMDTLILNYRSTFPPLNKTIGYSPTIFYPVNYSQILLGNS